MPELRAILWDVDGTLAETERDGHRVAFNRAFADLGLDWNWDAEHYGRLLAVTGGRERMLHEARQRAGAGPIDTALLDLIPQLHQRKNQHYAGIVAAGGIPLRPGVTRLLREIRAAGLLQAIVTTTSRANVEVLLSSTCGPDWQHLFSALVCGEDVGRKKPDPEAYLRALKALRLAADDCMAVEDSAPGLAAAGAAGIACVLTRSAYTDAVALSACPIAPRVEIDDLEQGLAMIGIADLRRWHSAPGR